jgi:hypothetical protein
MRRYAIGVDLLDKEDPSRVIARLDEPILIPEEDERDGYVPNVVYSCGAMVHNDQLIIPYAMSDSSRGNREPLLGGTHGATPAKPTWSVDGKCSCSLSFLKILSSRRQIGRAVPWREDTPPREASVNETWGVSARESSKHRTPVTNAENWPREEKRVDG